MKPPQGEPMQVRRTGLAAWILAALVAPALGGVAVAQTPYPARDASAGEPTASRDATAEMTALLDARAAVGRDELARARALLEPVARSTDPRRAARAHTMLGDIHERELRFGPALHAYRQGVTLDPAGRYASRALARIVYLEAHSEGQFGPLARLESVRRNDRMASDRFEIERLVRDARTFPAGLVRADARLLAAQAYAGRLRDRRRAIDVIHEIASDSSSPSDVRVLAADLLVQSAGARGFTRSVLADLERLRPDATVLDRVRRLARRERLRTGAIVVVAVSALVGFVALGRSLRRDRRRRLWRAWRRPLPLAHLGTLSLGGAVLARSYESHDIAPFAVLGCGALAIYLLASASSVAGPSHAAVRIVRSLLFGAATVALAFLAMYHFDPAMLDGVAL